MRIERGLKLLIKAGMDRVTFLNNQMGEEKHLYKHRKAVQEQDRLNEAISTIENFRSNLYPNG